MSVDREPYEVAWGSHTIRKGRKKTLRCRWDWGHQMRSREGPIYFVSTARHGAHHHHRPCRSPTRPSNTLGDTVTECMKCPLPPISFGPFHYPCKYFYKIYELVTYVSCMARLRTQRANSGLVGYLSGHRISYTDIVHPRCTDAASSESAVDHQISYTDTIHPR